MKGEWLRKPTGDSSVVFVHGILSSAESAWRHENGSYWPQLLADTPDLALLGIYTFTYRTTVFSGSYRLNNVVDSLKLHLRLDGVLRGRRTVFVCHSMGGIAVRKYLVQRAAELIEQKSEIGLFLVASPSLGSSYANLLGGLARILGHAQAVALRFAPNNDWLNDLDKEFQDLKEGGRLRLRGKELVEDRSMNLLLRKQVVQTFSGARYFGDAYKVPGSDHFSIAKPENAEAIQHRLLVQFIKDGEPAATEQLHHEASEPAGGGRTADYDRWYAELSGGTLRTVIQATSASDVNVLSRILSRVLEEKQFSDTIAGNARVVLSELLTNVARYATNTEAAVEVSLNTQHLPYVEVTVGDEGAGYDLWQIIDRQYAELKSGAREHGLGRVCRLSDQVVAQDQADGTSRHFLRSTLYDIPWPGSVADDYEWCEKVIVDYTASSPCVWFGTRRYPLWWYDPVGHGWTSFWAALGALNLAIDRSVPQIRELYLGHLTVASRQYLMFELRGHGFTETGQPRMSAATIAETLELFFAEHFAAGRVLLYASKGAYAGELKRLAGAHSAPLYVAESEKQLRKSLAQIDKALSRRPKDRA